MTIPAFEVLMIYGCVAVLFATAIAAGIGWAIIELKALWSRNHG